MQTWNFNSLLQPLVDSPSPCVPLTYAVSVVNLGVLPPHCDWCPVVLLLLWGNVIGVRLPTASPSNGAHSSNEGTNPPISPYLGMMVILNASTARLV